MSTASPPSRWRHAGIAALLLVLIAATGIAFLRFFAPHPPPEQVRPFEGYDRAAMDAAMATDAVARVQADILAFGSRLPGQPGQQATEEYLRAALRELGAELIEYPVSMPVPRTDLCRIVDASGADLADVEIHPFLPNHFQPMNTPEEGLAGTLVRVTDDVLLERDRFDDCIAVVDEDDAPASYAVNWNRYAQLGFRALIVTDTNSWDSLESSVHASIPVNYVRLAASPGILAHDGERVALHVRTRWVDAATTTLVARIRAPEATADGAREALAIACCTDACGIVPDRAFGALGASSVAEALQTFRGLVANRATLRRDLYFFAYASQFMAQAGADRLSSVLGPAYEHGETRRAHLEASIRENAAALDSVRKAAAAFDAAPGALVDPAATRALVNGMDPDTREFFAGQLAYTLNTLVMELSEVSLDARIDFLRTGEDDSDPAFEIYRKAKERYDGAMKVAGYPAVKLADTRAAFVEEHDVPGRFAARLAELQAYHASRASELEACLRINRDVAGYGRLVVLSPMLTPADPRQAASGESVGFTMGYDIESMRELQGPAFAGLATFVRQRLASEFRHGEAGALDDSALTLDPYRRRGHNNAVYSLAGSLTQSVFHFNSHGYPSATLVNTDRRHAYALAGTPAVREWMTDFRGIAGSLRFLGRFALSLAHGDGRFEPPAKPTNVGTVGGRVYVANIGQSIVPNYPLAGALFGHKGTSTSYAYPGYYPNAFQFTDVYGRYAFPFTTASIRPGELGGGYSPEACCHGRDGIIAYIKDEGAAGQSVYRSMNLGWDKSRGNVNIVVFRATPVAILDTVNPQNLKAFTGFGLLTREGLAPVAKQNLFAGVNDTVCAFIEPDRRFYLTLKAGSADNELVQTTRAFALGLPPADLKLDLDAEYESEIEGEGYLAADVPFLYEMPAQIAHAMLTVNGRRLDLQKRHGMADERELQFHDQGVKLLEEAPRNTTFQAVANQEREAATYAILNHPVLRESIWEAVVGVLWYLGLLVPFVFFFEKLVFGFSDIRRQLAAEAAIFLVVFVLLRLLHPAFAMIRSSMMILLGFVILLISGGITILFFGKFQENLEELRSSRGQVAAAEINKMGVLGTAFALGLNNMHRRAVRTGLTCATLVLLTFAMICFTSVHDDVHNVATAIGRAPYQGLLLRGKDYKPIQESELFAFDTRYGADYKVAERRMTVGVFTWDQMRYNPSIEIVYEPGDGPARRASATSILQFSENEPLRSHIEVTHGRKWVATKAEDGDLPAVLFPETLLMELGIPPAAVDDPDHPVKVSIAGNMVRVAGVFTASSLADLRDLDGRDLLPFDVVGMRTMRMEGNHVLATDDDPRLDAAGMVIAPVYHAFSGISRGSSRLVSIAVDLGDEIPYKQARELIDRYLEQSGHAAYYGIDGVAYFGKRTRERSMAGLLDLLIPLAIAAMTVLNTMRGSVYERKDEIFVYNAVGIAPKYIFAMFFSEAFVYSVVGSVLGFILSQGTGMFLSAIGFTGGLKMTFTSLNTIYASLAIMAAVFLSTLFPALSAMEIAAPAEESGWKMPEPEGDRTRMVLPFTFDKRDRVAVIEFFFRFFADHGEGSSGPFFAGPPVVGVTGEGKEAIPHLDIQVWLKPFDLGVSQQIRIDLPHDPETGEFLAWVTMERLSGSRESWIRLNKPFVRRLRRQFLYWRAVTPPERQDLFEAARERILARFASTPSTASSSTRS
jgi:hypothetical protein